MRRLALIAVVLGIVVLPAIALGQNPAPPAVTVEAASEMTQTTATVTGTVDPNGAATTWHVEYGTTTGYGLRTPTRDAGSGDGAVNVREGLTGLTADTTYHFRIVATNAAGVTRSADRTLRTQAAPRPPDAVTGDATRVTSTGATLRGTVAPRGLATTYYFAYGLASGSLTSRTPEVALTSTTATRTVSAAIEGLGAGRRYYYRLVARNAAGADNGSVRSFTTRRGPTGLTLNATPEPVVFGGSVRLAGRITGSNVSGVLVALERQRFPYREAATAIAEQRTASNGSYAFTTGPVYGETRFRVVTRTAPRVASATTTVRARVRVGIIARRRPGRRVRFIGSIAPAMGAGWRVSLQRRAAGGVWVRIARLGTTPLRGERSRYRKTVRLRPWWREPVFRVVVSPTSRSGYVRGYSRALQITATRP